MLSYPSIAQANGYLTPADAAAAAARNGAMNSTLHGGLGLAGDTTRLRNELEVVIIGCRDLPSRGQAGKDSVAPAAYVHYQVIKIPNLRQTEKWPCG